MRKIVVFLGAVVFFSACASRPPATVAVRGNEPALAEQWESGRVLAGSHDGALVVIGVSARLSSLEDEIEAARDSAAQKIAMFYGMSGSVEFLQRTGTSVFDFLAESDTNIAPTTADHTRFMDRLTFDPDHDVYSFTGHGMTGRNGTLVRFRYAAQVPQVTVAYTFDSDGRPSWVNRHNLPTLDGYAVVVGFSQNQVWLRDTVLRSANASAAMLITSISAETETVHVDVIGQGSLVYIRTRGAGTLQNFRILEFWVDPVNMSVYTLGIARLVS